MYYFKCILTCCMTSPKICVNCHRCWLNEYFILQGQKGLSCVWMVSKFSPVQNSCKGETLPAADCLDRNSGEILYCAEKAIFLMLLVAELRRNFKYLIAPSLLAAHHFAFQSADISVSWCNPAASNWVVLKRILCTLCMQSKKCPKIVIKSEEYVSSSNFNNIHNTLSYSRAYCAASRLITVFSESCRALVTSQWTTTMPVGPSMAIEVKVLKPQYVLQFGYNMSGMGGERSVHHVRGTHEIGHWI